MMRTRANARLLAVCLLVALAAAGGCGKKIWITQYPPFYTPDLKSVVVVPFQNATHDRRAGLVISDKVSTALMANATYEVFNRNDLAALTDQADLKAAAGVDTNALANILRRRGRVQAILTGMVTTYVATQHRERRQQPVYAYTKGGRRYLSHYKRYNYVRNEATVVATARLIRVADGTAIHATPVPAEGKVISETRFEGMRPPKMDRFACLAAAGDQCVRRLVEAFAVVRKQVKVGRNALRTAHELYDNKWQGGKTFRPADRRMFVVIAFPEACDRNHFVLRIVRKDQRAVLDSRPLIWQREWSYGPGKGFPFNPSELVAKGGGPGEFTVKLYSGPEPVLQTDFKIVPGK